MAPKKSQSSARRKPKGAQAPETADEQLAEAVEFEESAEKWRAGDISKSARFYTRALDSYQTGLARFPNSFDLAYNKARVQYQIIQNARLLEILPTKLEDALESHRRALALDSTNPDVLFNTAQVLTSLAEERANHDSEGQRSSALPLLEDAVGLFQQCLRRQEDLFTENKAFVNEIQSLPVDNDDGGVALTEYPADRDKQTREESPEEKWASIVEPVTESTLVDTIGAFLDCLAAICGLLSSGNQEQLKSIEELGANILIQHLSPLVNDEVRSEASLVSAKFKAAVLEAQYRLGIINVQAYDHNLKETFEHVQSLNTAALLTAYSEAIISFCATITDDDSTTVLRWTRLTKALDLLTEAAKSVRGGEAASIHVGRGDVDLLRFALTGENSTLPANLRTSQARETLLRNAETYYRGAAALAESTLNNEDAGIIIVAKVKQAVVLCLATDSNEPVMNLVQSGVPITRVQRIVADMVDESLIPASFSMLL